MKLTILCDVPGGHVVGDDKGYIGFSTREFIADAISVETASALRVPDIWKDRPVVTTGSFQQVVQLRKWHGSGTGWQAAVKVAYVKPISAWVIGGEPVIHIIKGEGTE
jgi:hypothetical protein